MKRNVFSMAVGSPLWILCHAVVKARERVSKTSVNLVLVQKHACSRLQRHHGSFVFGVEHVLQRHAPRKQCGPRHGVRVGSLGVLLEVTLTLRTREHIREMAERQQDALAFFLGGVYGILQNQKGA